MVRGRPGCPLTLAAAMLVSAAVLVAGCGQQAAPVRGAGQLLTGRVEKLPRAVLPPDQLTAATDAFGLALQIGRAHV